MTVVASSTMFYSCDTLEMEDLASPNSLSPDLADADLLLNNIQLSYIGAMQDMQYNGAALGRISHMGGRNYYNNFDTEVFRDTFDLVAAGRPSAVGCAVSFTT